MVMSCSTRDQLLGDVRPNCDSVRRYEEYLVEVDVNVEEARAGQGLAVCRSDEEWT